MSLCGKEGIVLGHKVSEAGLEVDKAKINLISKLPPPTNIKGVLRRNHNSMNDFVVYEVRVLQQLCVARLVIGLEKKQQLLVLEGTGLMGLFVIVATVGYKGSDVVDDSQRSSKRSSISRFGSAADHLSRIENEETSDDSEVDDNFPRETLMETNAENKPWFADFAIYLASDIIPKGMTYQQKKNFFSDIKHYFWEEPYLFKALKTWFQIYGFLLKLLMINMHYGESHTRDNNVSPSMGRGDCPRLRINNIEDMLLLVVQNRLINISGDDVSNFAIALRMKRDSYTPYQDPQGFIYVDNNGRNRLMRSDELYKFSDRTLTGLRTLLDDITKNIRMKYMPKRRWSTLEKKRANIMIKVIDK
ncbi:hypothetical protein Tco_0803179 [Tanacetum coccineum]|uniref:Uncharacterized protein n=1 Tax=Tanacetum coccineum TaxID=301880 RepID=A0ABQ5A3K3_9ASTR